MAVVIKCGYDVMYNAYDGIHMPPWCLTQYVRYLRQRGCDDIQSGWDGSFKVFHVRHTASVIIHTLWVTSYVLYKQTVCHDIQPMVCCQQECMWCHIKCLWCHTCSGCDFICTLGVSSSIRWVWLHSYIGYHFRYIHCVVIHLPCEMLIHWV